MLMLLASTLLARPAAAQTCTFGGFTANPALPTTLYVRNNYAVNDRVFSTTLSVSFSCTVTNGAQDIQLTVPNGVSFTQSLPTAPGLAYVVGNNTTAGPNTALINITSGGAICQGKINPGNKTYLSFSGNGTCGGNLTTAITFIATAANPTGTIPTILPAQSLFSGISGWIGAVSCVSSCFNIVSGSGFGSIQAPNAISLSTITSSCTLSSYNLTVALPTVSRSAFAAGIGSTAGRALIPLTITCPSGLSSTGLSLGVSYNPSTTAGVQNPTVIASTGTATNVGVRLYDSAGNGLTSGTAARITNAIAAGPYTSVLSASYVSTGTPVGPGTVNSTATIFLEYF